MVDKCETYISKWELKRGKILLVSLVFLSPFSLLCVPIAISLVNVLSTRTNVNVLLDRISMLMSFYNWVFRSSNLMFNIFSTISSIPRFINVPYLFNMLNWPTYIVVPDVCLEHLIFLVHVQDLDQRQAKVDQQHVIDVVYWSAHSSMVLVVG